MSANPHLTREQMEEAIMRLLAPKHPEKFREWLMALPLETLRLEYVRALELEPEKLEFVI